VQVERADRVEPSRRGILNWIHFNFLITYTSYKYKGRDVADKRDQMIDSK
jgi:hypothetical protein